MTQQELLGPLYQPPTAEQTANSTFPPTAPHYSTSLLLYSTPLLYSSTVEGRRTTPLLHSSAPRVTPTTLPRR